MKARDYQICTNCVMDTSDPGIVFDKDGKCDFCNNYYNVILPNWHNDENSFKELLTIADKIRKSGKNKKYDCIIGMSGGVDSSYLTWIVTQKLKLRPLLVSVDTGWNLNVANENVENLVKKLNLDLETIVIDYNEINSLQLAFLKSGVPYQDLPQDCGLFAALYNYAAKHKIKYILTGGNFATEGVKPPQEWTYVNDVKFLKDINKRFGNKKLKSYPFCGMFKKKIWYRYFRGIRIIWPLNYIDYNKANATKILEKELGWKSYENKHYENRFTRFYEGWWLPQKFGYDKRRCYDSSLILSGQMTREEALQDLNHQPYAGEIVAQDKKYICEKLHILESELDEYFKLPNKTYRDYKNSYGVIKFFIKLAMKLGIEKRNFR